MLRVYISLCRDEDDVNGGGGGATNQIIAFQNRDPALYFVTSSAAGCIVVLQDRPKPSPTVGLFHMMYPLQS
jgi:hypothetical protein